MRHLSGKNRTKRLLSFLLVFFFCMTPLFLPVEIPAAETQENAVTEGEAPEEAPVDDAAADSATPDGYWPEGIETSSQSAIVMEASTGTILYQKNIDEPHYPASITKILTALIALKYGNMSDIVTFSKEAVYNTEGSSIARDVGEQMTLEQCLYGMLLESANECAYAIAEHIAGSVDAFVDMMNEEAAALGCTNTHFSNPHGLPEETHYTSAHDMALIAQEAWKNETFRIITGTKRYEIPPTNKHSEITYLQNHNEMLNPYKSTKYLYEYCVGGKTGYTEVAKSTLVTYAQKDGMTLICVVMYADKPGHWTDTIGLFEYCFANFGLFNVAENTLSITENEKGQGGLRDYLPFAQLDPDAQIVLPLTASFQDAVPEVVINTEPGEVVGTVYYTYAGHSVGWADILATGAIAESYPFKVILSEKATGDGDDGRKKLILITPKKVLPVLLIIAFGALLVFLIVKFSSRLRILRRNLYRRKRTKTPYRRIRSRGFGRRRRRRRR
ncbi:MAG: D-alanyl-D-alanine carboxypeptidase [Lachnospiraceae bacterium]|nr:D-alanyl-D-alanine carboxypeptidase [Lachnospiraceae bacterium]